MPKRKRHQNRGAVFVDLDNFRNTVQEYTRYGARMLTLSPLLDWIADPHSLGLTRVSQIYVFGTYWHPLRPAGEETLIERRHRSVVRMINYPTPERPEGPEVESLHVPGYEDRVIRDKMAETQGYWDTAVIVSSDHIFFQWAEEIRRDRAPFAHKEAVNIFSHLGASTYMAATARNASSIEDIFPWLLPYYIRHRPHNPLEIADAVRLSA